jgi:hypothetical protein
MPRPLTEADDRLRADFGLPDDTTALLPGRGTFIVSLRLLTESQARAILQAAKDAGVDLGGQR